MKFKPLRIFIFLAIECQTPCQAMGNISDGNQSSKNSKNSSIGLILKRINSSTTTEEWHSCFVSSRAGYCVFFCKWLVTVIQDVHLLHFFILIQELQSIVCSMSSMVFKLYSSSVVK